MPLAQAPAIAHDSPQVEVYRRPVVALLSTGDEIIDLQAAKSHTAAWGGIWDTNRPSLEAALRGMGYDVVDLGIVPDTFVASSVCEYPLTRDSSA